MTNEEDFECLADLCRRHKFRDPEQAAEEILEIRRQYFEDELVRRFLPLTEHLDKICDELESLEPEAKAQLAASITLHITPRNPVDAADAFIEAVKAVRSFVAGGKKPKEPSVGRPPETRRDVLLASLALFHERHAGVPFRESRNDTPGRGSPQIVGSPPPTTARSSSICRAFTKTHRNGPILVTHFSLPDG